MDFGGRVITSYRHHPNHAEWRTRISILEGSSELPLNLPEKYEDMSHEDGRFFIFRGKLHISLTRSVFPGVRGTSIPCATAYGEIEKTESGWVMRDVIFPKYGKNNFQGQEKNFVFFESGGSLNCIYECSPDHQVLRLDDVGGVVEVFRTKSPSWKHGDIRGGTSPILHNGKWLRFFHSLHKNGFNRANWSYCIGAMLMSQEPPYTIESISKSPVFSGDERYVNGWKFWKPSVAIPYGAVKTTDGWNVSIGLNDSYCAILPVKKEHLNL